MFFPPLVVMRVKALLSSYGFWSWLLVFFLALGLMGVHAPVLRLYCGAVTLADILSGVGKN